MYGNQRNRPVTSGPYAGGPVAGGRESANLGDILERVLDKGIVIAGDIRVNLLDIELLTIKLRLLVVSVETARELGIDWWEHDPWLTGDRRGGLEEENRRLRERIADLEDRGERPAVEAPRERLAGRGDVAERANRPEREDPPGRENRPGPSGGRARYGERRYD